MRGGRERGKLGVGVHVRMCKLGVVVHRHRCDMAILGRFLKDAT